MSPYERKRRREGTVHTSATGNASVEEEEGVSEVREAGRDEEG